MSIANYTLPLAASAPPPFIGTQNYGTAPQASAINSLLYDTPRFTQTRQSYFPPSPNRRQPTNSRKVKDNRDPYRNQYPQKPFYQPVSSSTTTQKKNVDDYDEYFNESNYEFEEDSYDKNYSESEPHQQKHSQETSTTSSNSKTKRKLSTSQQPPPQPTQRQNRELPSHPPTYKRIANTFNSVPEPGAKTSLHAVLDFDDDFDDYSYEDEDVGPVPPSLQWTPKPQVTPIEGPILIKNGSVPVVPLYSYPIINNGTLVQIPVSIYIYIFP